MFRVRWNMGPVEWSKQYRSVDGSIRRWMGWKIWQVCWVASWHGIRSLASL
ncbi:MAG TPA: hypothetical protein VMJ11_16850 [Paraburkholderia sp.]|uniref:hypothetical protein n=1 Tax=Paraburkholderia sp. TaxID=1926495 RepID=UPI002B82183E|nr:hypothetical protein [Paraburkholderia sp.]HTR08279.1 hypothetical protein [Paraburkholderia sp.]